MASRKQELDKANELFEDIKRAVGPTKFRRFLLILREVKRDGYDIVDIRYIITKVRGVIGHREDLILRFMEFVNGGTNRKVSEESGSTLRDTSASDVTEESDRVRVALNFDDVDKMGQRHPSSEISPHSKGEERVRKTLNFDVPGYIEKGEIQQRQQSKVPSYNRIEERGSVRRTLNFDVPENMERKIQQHQQSEVPSYRSEARSNVRRTLNFIVSGYIEKGKIQQLQSEVPAYSRSEERSYVRRTLNFDLNENKEKGKIQQRKQSDVPSYSRSEERGCVRRTLNFDVPENKEKGKIQQRQQLSDHSLDSRLEESREGSNLNGDKKREEVKMTPRQQSENTPDSSIDKQEGIRKVMNIIRSLQREGENIKQCHQSVIEATPHRKEIENCYLEPEVRKIDGNVQHVYKVLQLNGDVLDILRDVIKIVDRRYSKSTGNDSYKISAEILRLINEVLDNVERVFSDKKHTMMDFINISAEVLGIIEKVIQIAEEGLSDDTLVEKVPNVTKVFLEEQFSNNCANKENDASSISGDVNQLLEDVIQRVEKEFPKTKHKEKYSI